MEINGSATIAAWDYCLSTVFSANVSGHTGHGLLVGTLIGADWLTGGIFGVEASAITPVVILIAGIYFILTAKNRDGFTKQQASVHPKHRIQPS